MTIFSKLSISFSVAKSISNIQDGFPNSFSSSQLLIQILNLKKSEILNFCSDRKFVFQNRWSGYRCLCQPKLRSLEKFSNINNMFKFNAFRLKS